MTERDAETSALAGPARERRARRRRASPPCAPMPGSRSTALRQQPPRLGDLLRERRADDRADRRQAALADEVLAPLAHELRDVLPERRPSASSTSCTSAPPGFEVLTRQKMPAPSRRQASRNGSSESRPRYGLTVTASASGMNAVGVRAARSSRCRRASRRRSRAARPRARTRTPPRTRARPSAPSASKNADCGLTATA